MKPLLAEKVDLNNLLFPVYTSVKIDGFRCLIHQADGPITRSMKPIPNHYVRTKLSEWGLAGLDGELITTTGGKMDEFNAVQSKLATRSGMPDFEYLVFDRFLDSSLPFSERFARAKAQVEALNNPRVKVVEHVLVHNLEQLLAFEDKAVTDGFEGSMVRDPQGRYKYGRSTLKEGILLKVKRLDDDEAEVVHFQERRTNTNEPTRDALGYQQRSSHQENMVPCGDLGALTVEWRGVQFDVGTGFTAAQRVEYWNIRDSLLGRKVTFAYQGVGSKGRPRFPRFKGFRAEEDVS
jgi:DNA ligase-1